MCDKIDLVWRFGDDPVSVAERFRAWEQLILEHPEDGYRLVQAVSRLYQLTILRIKELPSSIVTDVTPTT
ncbi:MAG: hypothetical protein ABIP75_13205 [Pyrinomonadaceae bacterium]